MDTDGVEILIFRAVLFYVFACSLSLWADGNLLLETQERIVPKIMALDLQLGTRMMSNKAILGVVYDEAHKSTAFQAADDINHLYNGRIANIPFNSVALSMEEVMQRRDIAFIYLMQTDSRNASRIAAWANANAIPTFSYDVANLRDGIFGSVAIERNTVIYINKNVLKTVKFRFNDNLYKIARLIE